MKLFLPLLVALLWMARPLLAQETATQSTLALPDLPISERLEGEIIESRGGATITAKLQYETPDKLRIEIEASGDALVPAQTIIASGDETRLYEPATKRVRRLPYNVAKEWWHGWNLQHGGPANVVLFGLRSAELARFYRLDTGPATRLALHPRDEWIVAQRGEVLFGGTAESSFYAAHKNLTPLVAPTELHFAGEPPQSRLQRREEKRWADGKEQASAQVAFLFQGWDATTGIPVSSTVVDGAPQANKEPLPIGHFQYLIKPRVAAFPDGAFDFPAANDQIIEDAELKPIAEYSAGDANALFNKGVALALHTESYAEAMESWKAVAMLMPQAVAPAIASFDLALSTRDIERAREELARLSTLLGGEHFEVAMRAVQLASAQRDWKAAHDALTRAQKAQPQNLSVALLRADLLRAQGEYSAAQSLLIEVLKNDSPQSLALAPAAEMLAEISDETSAPQLAVSLETGNQWQRLARALLLLRQNKSTPAPELESPYAQASLAAGYERAAAWDEARVIWQKVADSAPVSMQSMAKSRLMALEARQGTPTESLRLHRELLQYAGSQIEQKQVRDMLLEAWRKSFRQDELRAAIEQRALALSAAEDDARLWLAFQENYGSDAQLAAALKAGLTRYARSAWWQSRRANQMVAQISPQGFSPAAVAARERLSKEAVAALDEAIKLEPRQPFYAVQRALVLTQRATLRTGVVDASLRVANRRAASEALDALAAKWKNDPDVRLSVLLQRLALEPAANYEPIIAQLQETLRAGVPGRDGANRHTFVMAARQALASAYRQQGNFAQAAAQYELLIATARDAAEQTGIALNYLNLLAQQDDAASIARLITKLAREPWEYSAWQETLVTLLSTLAPRRPLSSQVATQLRAGDDPYALLARAQLEELLAQLAAGDAARPDAPVGAENVLAGATRDWNQSLQQLAALTQGNDRLLAGRAAAALAETLLNQNAGVLPPANVERALGLLQNAVNAEPRDANLRAARAQVLLASQQREQALAARDAMLQSLPPTPDNLRRAAELSLRLSDAKMAATLARRALEYAQAMPESSPGEVQQSAFTLARALMTAGQTTPAMEWYFKLALPQWPLEDRATALIDLQNRLQAAGQNAQAQSINERLRALGLSDEQLAALQANG